MKNKQKARRRCALASAVLLCILAILPVLFVPASAEIADTVPEDYIYIQWEQVGSGTAGVGWTLRVRRILRRLRSCTSQTSAGTGFVRCAAGEEPGRFSDRFLRSWI